ncbi:DUF2066 domain-containing protein [Kineobactrum salinum]|uniref:DUF2066 domain-containing protein n=1 Tax=Kineobactrum salinum TaxID=2708301 RepID=A0A6C0U7I2_9GAMM|nr:DUF2066 domain-containing protein [Kineobactrum salinum]QIB66395.1 DUF2066 domain-containing protein [Kineobactrum salinum]
MTRLMVRLAGLLVLLLAAVPVLASELVRDLYVAEVAVEDRSAAELARASGEGLARVLVKVSGSREVLALPQIEQALKSARNQVLQYSYSRTGRSPEALAARVEFDPGQVRGLLTAAGAPLWTANRPVVLLWLVQDDGGERSFVTEESAPELTGTLIEAFRRRGIPVRLPLFDLTDSAALSPDQAWQLSAPRLHAASRRYGVTEVLAGRVATLSSEDRVGDWTYLAGDNKLNRSVTRASVEEFVARGVSLVAEDMAARYAVAATGLPDAGLTMVVSGVTSYADYAGIVSWLESLELIERASVTTIRGDQLSLQLTAQADAGHLATIIELNPRLTPAAGGTGTQLSYRWRS